MAKSLLTRPPSPLQLLGQLHELPCPLTGQHLAITGPQLPPSWGCVSIHSRDSRWASAAAATRIRPQALRALPAPAGLRPELVPSVEVEKVLPTVNNPAVLELEDDAAANIQVLAVPLRAVVMNADHAAVITR